VASVCFGDKWMILSSCWYPSLWSAVPWHQHQSKWQKRKFGL
jgi:hypothetical protein